MAEGDLGAIWNVLETESSGDAGVSVVESSYSVPAGDILLGIDPEGCRHVLIPLLPGEAFAADRGGRSVHMRRLSHGRVEYLDAVCLHRDLNGVFARFTWELIQEVRESSSPARTTVDALARWRRLFAEAGGEGQLSTNRVIGLLAELMTLEQVLAQDLNRDVSVWTGPEEVGAEHDFRRGPHALEVKATLRREGRMVGISSVDQLDPPLGGTLHMTHFRFEPDPAGVTLPGLVQRVRDLCPDRDQFDRKLAATGYREQHGDHYAALKFSVVDTRTYDVLGDAFPRIVPSSFLDGVVPSGTLRINYTIDLTNSPPYPVSDQVHSTLIERLAGQ